MQPISKYDTTLKERDRSFRGTAKIDFVHLQFEDCFRQLDLKNVSRLVKVFEKEGCARLKPENRVPAIIPDEVLKVALQKNGLALDLNRSPFHTDHPKVSFSADLRIQCLHGQHRIRAAEKYLPKADRWWVVDLFSSGIFNHSAPFLNSVGNVSQNSRRKQSKSCGSSAAMEKRIATANFIAEFVITAERGIQQGRRDGRLG